MLKTEDSFISPDYLFEVSWEVCNKVGGVHASLTSKAFTLVEEMKDNYILIGPDILRETHQNPEFIEDRFLYKSWREKAESEGLRIRVGHWNIPAKPIVILADFTPYFSQKDKIFAKFWESYKLDSLTGGWDYIEPALFGYAAGKIIESFYDYNLSVQDKMLTHFHEWMTGMGILYLKEFVPQAGTLLTLHSTVIGRCIADNNLPLYRDMENYIPEVIAKQFGVVSKFSLEKITAKEVDTVTTNSEITSQECNLFLGRDVSLNIPNGFDDSMIPVKEEYNEKRNTARTKILKVTEMLTGQEFPDNTILILHSGRYEFRNKGIDLFIETMGRLNHISKLPQTIIACIAVPAYHTGPRKNLIEKKESQDIVHTVDGVHVTHELHEPENDLILRKIKAAGLHNGPDDRVKIIYIPALLNGADGIFNLDFPEFLIAFDGTIFPYYYEPWGYTPLESLAFHIPTITTSLSGLGQWIKSLYPGLKECTMVIDRDDDNDNEVIEEIIRNVIFCSQKTEKEIIKARLKAYEISRTALWKNVFIHHRNAYSDALNKALAREDLYMAKRPAQILPAARSITEIKPEWKKVLIQQCLPENLQSLERIARNLWWSWNYDALELFEMINNERWYDFKFNPIALIESLSFQELQDLNSNDKFVSKLKKVTTRFDYYMAKAAEKSPDLIAYFSMEFGLHDTIKIFSGGLGMLAGDYLKEASDSNANIIGVGLLYRYGYFRQTLSIYGDQIAGYTPQKFTHLPLIPIRDKEGNWQKITLFMPGRSLSAKVWRVDVGRIPLYLLDTDIEENQESDRVITHQLYGGDLENRLKQEILLGIGGIRMIELLGIKPIVYHSNEGHSAFISIERLRRLIQNEKLTFPQALEVVRSSTLFTTHTPVPAGHDAFPEELIRRYLPHYPDHLNITWDQFMNLGRMIENDPHEKYSMSVLAAKLSQDINGVSRIHGRVTREMFVKLYPGYYPNEIHIGYVTNGVHYPTWTAKSWQALYQNTFGDGFFEDQSNPHYWQKIHEVDDEIIWKTKLKQKEQLNRYLADRVYEEMTRRHENPRLIFKVREAFRPEALTIGFARRFATYKRAHLLFSNLDRLSRIVNNKARPVQFLFAGKAHPHDKAGQDLIKKIFEISRTPEFMGKILFIENYDMELAKYLIRGVDIWLNTPTRPLEASGTSGEKAVMNGVVNFSVLDGWWAEGYKKNAGWALSEESTFDNPQFQDELDAEQIYTILEEEIVPFYYEVNEKKIPAKWVSYIKNTISEIAPHYTMKRQLEDYIRLYYSRLIKRSKIMTGKNYEMARHIASWKRKVLRGWDSIEVISLNVPDSNQKPLSLGESFKAEIILNLNELSGSDVGIEVLFGKKINDEVHEPIMVEAMEIVRSEKNIAVFGCDIPINRAGVYDFVFRLFPKSPLLPHRQDFNLVKWI
jgi:phosphorylase/glycogen(starch) synthase